MRSLERKRSAAKHKPVTQDLEEDKPKSPKLCRVCYDTTYQHTMLAPCLCSGGQKWIHRDCLNQWRSQDSIPYAFNRCPTCLFEYATKPTSKKPTMKQRIKYYVLVTRDVALALTATLMVILLASLFAYYLDTEPTRPLLNLIPIKSPNTNQGMTNYQDVAPYLIYGFLFTWVLLGAIMMCTHLVRDINSGSQLCSSVFSFECLPTENESLGCIMLFVAILAFVGLIVGLLMGIQTLRYIFSRHIKVLWLKGEAERVEVMDLSKNPEQRV